MKYNFSYTISELKNDKTLDLDFTRLKLSFRKFKNLILNRKKNQFNSQKQFETVTKLINARQLLDDMLIFFNSHFDPTVNEYIKEADSKSQAYRNFTTNIGIVQGLLDMLQQDSKIIENRLQFEKEPIAPIKVTNFRVALITTANNLIAFALVNSYEEYKYFNPSNHRDKEGKIPQKDRLLYNWFLFREVSKTSQILGSVSRQMVFSEKLNSLKSLETANKIGSLDMLPSNLKYKFEEDPNIKPITNPFEEVDLDVI